MRRLIRWRSNLRSTARATLILLSAAWLVLWVISFWYCHTAYVGHHRGTAGGGLNLRLTPGALEVTAIRFVSDPGRSAQGLNAFYEVRSWAADPGLIRHREWVRAGLGVHRRHETVTSYGPKYTNYYWEASLPLWLLAVLCAVWPALHWRSRRTRCLRVAAGRCPACGYDLRGSPERWPECGTLAGTSTGVA